MTIMTDELFVDRVPALVDVFGYDEVYSFYKNNLVWKMPNDIKIEPISNKVSRDQVVGEPIISFTHDREIAYMFT